MAIRIVNEDGVRFKTKVYDTETGEDLTSKLMFGAISLNLTPAEIVTAQITVYTPQIDITVEEAEMKHVCPYCGHETKEKNNASTETQTTSKEAC